MSPGVPPCVGLVLPQTKLCFRVASNEKQDGFSAKFISLWGIIIYSSDDKAKWVRVDAPQLSAHEFPSLNAFRLIRLSNSLALLD